MAVYTCKTYFDCIEHATNAARELTKDLKRPAIIFCEDKLTLSVEEALAKKAGGSFSVEVSSFGRYVSKRLPSRNTLSKEGTAMTVKKILSRLSPELETLCRVSKSPSLATEIGELIAQLKSAKISPSELLSATDDLVGRSASKIRDVAKIFGEYEKFLTENRLTDSNNALSDMLKAIDNDENMPRTRVIFLGLSSLTKQSAAVVEKLVKTAFSADFFVVKGNNRDLYVNEFFEFCKRFDPSPKTLPTFANAEGEKLLNSLYDPTILAEDDKRTDRILQTDRVLIYDATDVADETDFIAKRIRREVIENGARYRDIAIAVGNTETYSLILKRTLKDYSIPFFSDEKRTLDELPLSRLVDSFLKAAAKRDLNEVKRIINNSLFIFDKKISDEILRRIILGSTTYKSFIAGKFEQFEIFEETKLSLLITHLGKLENTASAKDYSSCVRGFLDECGIRENEKLIAEKLENYDAADEYSMLDAESEKFGNVLDEIENVLGDEILSLDEFRRTLNAGAQACEVSVIPQRKDCVYVGELKNCRFKQYDHLFVAGLTADVPTVKGDAALLLDSDIADLEKLSLSIEPKIRVVNEREKEASGIALASFAKTLTLTFPALSPVGSPTAKSRLLEYITKCFYQNNEPLKAINKSTLYIRKKSYDGETRDKADAFDFIAPRPALFSLVKKSADFKEGAADDLLEISSFYTALELNGDEKDLKTAESLLGKVNRERLIRKNISTENYFPKGRVSASVLECFYSCPYKCFMRYGAGATDAATGDARSLDYGNVLHAVAEKLVASYDTLKNEKDCREFAVTAVKEILSQDAYKRFYTRPDFAYSLKLLEDEAEKLCLKIYAELQNSQFVPDGQEVWFDDFAPVKAYPLNTKRRGFRLYGKADRVDKFGDLVRIIDYKTGHADEKVKDKRFYTGLNMQLYLYMNAFARGGNKPAGAYYYALDDNYVKSDEKKISMYGKTLKDETVVKATDKAFFENGGSSVIGGSLKKGKLDGNAFAEETDLRAYMRYAEILAEKAVDDVCDGVIAASPYDGACEYCEFGSSCGYDSDSGFDERKIADRIYPKHISAAVAYETKTDDATEEK